MSNCVGLVQKVGSQSPSQNYTTLKSRLFIFSMYFSLKLTTFANVGLQDIVTIPIKNVTVRQFQTATLDPITNSTMVTHQFPHLVHL